MSTVQYMLMDPKIVGIIIAGVLLFVIIFYFMIQRDKKTKVLLEAQALKRNGKLIHGVYSTSGQDLELPFDSGRIVLGFNKGDTHNKDVKYTTIFKHEGEPSAKAIEIYRKFFGSNRRIKGENVQKSSTNDVAFDKVFGVSTTDPAFALGFLDMNVRKKILDRKEKIINISVIGKGMQIEYSLCLPCQESELDDFIDTGINLLRHLQGLSA